MSSSIASRAERHADGCADGHPAELPGEHLNRGRESAAAAERAIAGQAENNRRRVAGAEPSMSRSDDDRAVRTRDATLAAPEVLKTTRESDGDRERALAVTAMPNGEPGIAPVYAVDASSVAEWPEHFEGSLHPDRAGEIHAEPRTATNEEHRTVGRHDRQNRAERAAELHARRNRGLCRGRA